MPSAAPTAADLALRRNLASGVFALFAAGAGIAQALGAPLWLKLMFAAIAVLGALIALVFLWNERKAHEDRVAEDLTIAERVLTAVGLDLSRGPDGTRLWVANQGLHVVRDIEITAIPDEEDWMPSTHGPLPRLYRETGPDVVLTTPIAGGWFHASVDNLSPGRGVCVVHYEEEDGDYQRMDIDVRWNDHEGRQRKSHVSADLRQSGGSLETTQRETT